MELRLTQQTEGCTEYAGVLAGALGIVIELHLKLVEGGAPQLILKLSGDEQQDGEPFAEVPITQLKAEALLAEYFRPDDPKRGCSDDYRIVNIVRLTLDDVPAKQFYAFRLNGRTFESQGRLRAPVWMRDSDLWVIAANHLENGEQLQ